MISILYVDDETDFADICRLYLDKSGDFFIDTSESAPDAIQKLMHTRYDVIISDYHMPGMDGIELLKYVRTTYGDIPFILFTGRGREDVVIKALNNGADFYLQKGSDIQPLFTELVHMIHQAVGRKRAEDALRNSLSKLSHAERITGLGYWSFDLNTNTVFASEGARIIYGLGTQEWSISEVQKIPLPEYRQLLDKSLQDLISEEKQYSVEFQIKRPTDGRIIDIHSIAEYDPATNQVFGTIQDITRIKEVERELRKKNEELQNINELFHLFMLHSPIYIFIKEVTSDESRVLYASENYLDMIGIPGSRMTGKNMYELFPHDFAEKITADDFLVVTRGEVLKLHETLGDRHYITYKFPLVQKNRTLLAGNTIDITELHKTQEALHEANQKLRLLTGLTRHDVFNDLSVIMGYQDLIAESTDPEDIHMYVAKAKKACEQIIATISFTREYEDFGTSVSQWHNVCRIIDSAKSEVNPEKIEIFNKIPDNCEIYSDPVIRKVFTTLLENAIRHGESITIIEFSHRMEDNKLIITCQDDGIGIPYHEKNCIFNHKYGKHTGIGLFLAKEILSITGLSIRECGEPGKGARFEIIVPEHGYRFVSE